MKLVSVDLETCSERIRDACSARTDIAAAYVFGSALSLCRPNSDIDVAVIIKRRPEAAESPKAELRQALLLEAGLERQLGSMKTHDFHVTALDADEPFFAMEAISSGRLVYVGDVDIFTDFLEVVARRYADEHPRYERALREVLEESPVHEP